jgi:hypothetical protein
MADTEKITRVLPAESALPLGSLLPNEPVEQVIRGSAAPTAARAGGSDE